MRELELNLHFDDSITSGKERITEKETISMIRTTADIEKEFPNVVCKSEYPPPVKFFKVPFMLSDKTPVRRKPYAISRAKQDFVRQELANLKKN